LKFPSAFGTSSIGSLNVFAGDETRLRWALATNAVNATEDAKSKMDRK